MKGVYDTVIIGGGAAGVGMAVTLEDFGVSNYVILEKSEIGSSFLRWPTETRFITPSFSSNQFNLLDLNSVSYNTSPAFTFQKEHMTGAEYAEYLKLCVKYFNLKVKEGVEVEGVTKEGDIFIINTNLGKVKSKNIIMAVGEYSFPSKYFENAIHTSSIKSYKKLKGEDFAIIGGYESGADAAIHLVDAGKSVTIFAKENLWNIKSSDPSQILSPFTHDRLAKLDKKKIKLITEKVESVRKDKGLYIIKTNKKEYTFNTKPIDATGFGGDNFLQKELFEYTDEGLPKVTDKDESTKVSGVFLTGPKLKHDKTLFCFIFKFRERFAVVAHEIGKRLGVNRAEVAEFYKSKNMYLDDLSCCQEECAC